MTFSILGPLEVHDQGRRIPIPGRKPRLLLAHLLLRRNQVVPVEDLSDALWGPRRPRGSSNTLQVHLSQLRKALAGLSGTRVVTRPPGYLLEAADDDVDACRFERLVEEAAACLEQKPDRSRDLIENALNLWRGPALADFEAHEFAHLEIVRLDELRLRALEIWNDAALGSGRAEELIPRLRALIAEHPLYERFRSQLMLALYREGRQADALAAYQDARRALDAVGLEPTRTLRELEQSVLVQDPELDGGSRTESRADPRRRRLTVVAARMVLVGPACDPEAVSELSAQWETEAAKAIGRHGGRVQRLTGDSLLGLFGASDAHEDDALRAARAGMEVCGLLSGMNAELEHRLGVRLESAVALTAGEVVIDPASGAVTGLPLSAAAALADSTRPGEVRLDASTRAALGAAAALAKDGADRWRLLDLSPPGQRSPLRLAAPMVGRDAELARLSSVLRDVERGRRPQLVLVTGPAGIGKSRLAEEFRRSIESATIAAGRCLPYGDGITFWPLAEIVRQSVGDTSAETLARFLRGDPDSNVVAAQLAGALGAGGPSDGGEETFWAARRFLERLARRGPLVLILEDLHWAEERLLDLVEYLVDWLDAPVLLLGLARPELLDARPSLAKVTVEELPLKALGDDAARTLVRHLTKRVRALDRDRIIEAGEGNPLFIEELALSFRREADASAIPPTIHALIAARLDRLGDPRAVLEIASVIGKEFTVEALATLAQSERRAGLEAHLDALTADEFIRGEEGKFRFRHILVRDVAYAGIPKARRAELHECFAEWLAAWAGSRLAEFEEVVGYHLEQAVTLRRAIGAAGSADSPIADRAAGHLARAARRAYARDDRRAEARLLSRAVTLLEPASPLHEELCPDLADALRDSGDFKAASRLVYDLRAAAPPGAPAFRAELVGLRVALQTQAGFHLDEIERASQGALEPLASIGDHRWLARAWELLAWASYLRCRAANAEEPLDRALRHARAARDRREEGRLLSLLFSVMIYGPLPVQAAIVRCRSILNGGAIGRIRASTLRALASLRAMEGDFAEARKLFREDRRLLRELGLPLVAARASAAYGQLELLAGDPERAGRELRRGLAKLKRFGELGAASNVAAVLAQALCEQGNHVEGFAVSGFAKETAAAEDVSAQVYWRMTRGCALIHLGDAEAGEAMMRSAVARAEKTDFLNTHAEALASLASAVGDERLRDQAIGLYDRKGNVAAARRLRPAVQVY